MSEPFETQEWTMTLDPVSGEVVAIRIATDAEVEEWELADEDDGDAEADWELT